jgi:hypothetical protein
MEKPSSAKVSLKWGIISSMISIVFTTIAYNTEIWKQNVWMFIFGIISGFVLTYFCLKEFKTQNQGFMTFGEGFGLGVLVSTVSSILSMTLDFIYKKFLDESLNQKILNFTEESLEARGTSPEQMEEILKKTIEFQNSGLAFLFGILFLIFIGAIISLLVSAILYKNKPVFD